MKKLPLVLSVGSVALLLGGCPSSPTSQSQPITQESPSPAPAPSPPAVPPPAFPGATQPATRPPIASVELIPSTDPDQERARIVRGRTDPTALFSLQPNITIEVEKEPVVLPPRRSNTRIVVKPSRVKPVVAVNPPPPPPLPPQPVEARGVQVSGIVQLPTTPMAIVKAPGERTERRVIPGSTLSNGAILVKAIDTNPDDPSIVLEQYGQTVIRKLGAGTQAPTAATPTAPVPQSAIVYPEPGEGGS